MHEYSIVQALLEQIDDIAKENKTTQVTKVITKIGVMSGVETHLLQTAFHTFKENTICENSEFIMQIQAVVIQCNKCKEESILEKLHYCCKNCQSIDVNVIDGEDMFLMSLEME